MRGRMGHRGFLRGSLTACSAVATVSAPAMAQGKRTLKLMLHRPKGSPGPVSRAQRRARLVTEASDEQLEVVTYGPGELLEAFGSFDAVSQERRNSPFGPMVGAAPNR